MSGGGAAPGARATWSDLLARVIAGHDLAEEDTAWAMNEVMEGNADPVVLGGFLTALATKGETVEELRGLADSMLDHAVKVDLPSGVVDIVGTGGDRLFTVNISTMASLVIAGAGVPVVKHGNRASSSRSGSADVLEALGITIDPGPRAVQLLLADLGMTFCFANVFHPSMSHVAPVRRALGVSTAFNVLGPLTNPARPTSAAIGVSNLRHAPVVAGVLARRGTSGLVFRGRDNGLDELSTTTVNQVWEVTDGVVHVRELDAVAELGLAPSTVADLRGGDAEHNARVVVETLSGAQGPVRETVLLNAAAAFVAIGTLPGTSRLEEPALTGRLAAGLAHARDSLDLGAALGTLRRWVELSDQAKA